MTPIVRGHSEPYLVLDILPPMLALLYSGCTEIISLYSAKVLHEAAGSIFDHFHSELF